MQQPVTIAISASATGFRFYKKGVLLADDCTSNVNHAVVVVGFTSGKAEPKCKVTDWWISDCTSAETIDSAGDANYWKVQNSWGTGWGDQGFIKMEISGGKGTCGMNSYSDWVEFDFH